jgi:transcriptional regulator with XRE-family HTH domain
MTQRQIAERIGVTPGFIAKIESGESMPGYSVCVALTNVLDLGLDELWASVEAERREADDRRRQARGLVATGPIRVRGAVRTRGAVVQPSRPARGPAEIAREIASDPDLLTAYGHLRVAMSDLTLRTTVMTTLEAWAALVKGKGSPPRGR